MFSVLWKEVPLCDISPFPYKRCPVLRVSWSLSLWQPSLLQDPADDWTEHISSSGKKYYYNCRTEVSQWEKPKDLLERQGPVPLHVQPEIFLIPLGVLRTSHRAAMCSVAVDSQIVLAFASGNNDRKTRPRWRQTVSPRIWTTDKRPCRTKPRLVRINCETLLTIFGCLHVLSCEASSVHRFCRVCVAAWKSWISIRCFQGSESVSISVPGPWK